MRTLTCVVALIGIVAGGGCGGGGGDGGDCKLANACGGEIAAGKYKISSYCTGISGTIKPPSCPAGITVGSSSITATGDITFNADKTYSAQITLAGTVVETIPASCLSMGQVSVTCDQLTQLLQQEGMTGSCTGSGACTCNLTLPNMPSMADGTYATSGTTLTMTPTGEASSSNQYCATPTSVTVTSSGMSSVGASELMGMLMGASTMVLTKE